jgi:plastocyanin
MSDDQTLQSRRNALKCMVYGGAEQPALITGIERRTHMIHHNRRTLSVVLAAAMLSWMTAGAAVHAGPPDSAQIAIKNFMFSPTSLTIKAGSAVTWVNKDEEPHTVVSDTGLFRSNAVDTDEKFVFKFDKPGTYHFACSIHPRMVGTIIVE